MESIRCTSCGTSAASSKSFVIFNCPNCGGSEIRRCGRCKVLGREYSCNECGFEGP